MPSSVTPLSDKTILIAEDEYFIAAGLAEAISEAGATVSGPFPSVEEALSSLHAEVLPDAAVLNVRLLDGQSFPLADELTRAAIPFLFASGNDASDIPARFARRPHMVKPFTRSDIVRQLVALMGAGSA